MSDRPLIDSNLALLHFSGLFSYKNNVRGKFRKIFLITLILVVSYIDTSLSTFLNWNKSDSIENILVVLGFSQILLKIAAFNSNYILSTVNKMKLFYPSNTNGLKRQEKINGKIYSKIKFCLRWFNALITLVIVLFFLKSFFVAEMKLPYASLLDSWGSPYFEIGMLYEVVVMVLVTPLQMGFDGLYISLITNLVCEFKLLKADFAQIPIHEKPENDEITWEVLRNLIKHHNAVYDCSKSLRRAYYIPFLCIFVFNMLGIGFCLLCLIANGLFGNIATTLLYGLCAYFYIAQLFLYCAPGTILILESTKVSDVIFNTNWWIKTQPKLRKAYVRILQRANKPVLLSAGGMMNVTLESFNAIVKSALSFFTCVRALYRKI